MAKKERPRVLKVGDHVVVHWVDHCEYEDVPFAHDSFRLIRFETFGRLDYIDDEKVHLTRTAQISEDSTKNTVLIIGRGMITGVTLYREAGACALPE